MHILLSMIASNVEGMHAKFEELLYPAHSILEIDSIPLLQAFELKRKATKIWFGFNLTCRIKKLNADLPFLCNLTEANQRWIW